MLLLFVSCSGQSKDKQVADTTNNEQMTHFEPSPETAHPRAKELMNEDFYWSPVEETGPFGNDDGSDAFYGFLEWREGNQATSPVVYIKELIQDWGYPPFDLNEMNEDNLRAYTASSPIGARALTGQDNVILAVGFGQFVLEGRIDEDLRVLTRTAIKRELLPSMLSMWEGEYGRIRSELLKHMFATVEQMNK